MPDQHLLGNHGTEASRSCQSDQDHNQMKEKSDHIAHPGMLSKPTKHLMSASNRNSPWTGRSLPCLQFLRGSPEPVAVRFLNPVLCDLVGR
jgi:hypothetical protein